MTYGIVSFIITNCVGMGSMDVVEDVGEDGLCILQRSF